VYKTAGHVILTLAMKKQSSLF